jgi:hypothetical protein
VPFGAPADQAEKLRAQNFATIAGLEEAADAPAEARRQKCSHWLHNGRAVEV